MPPLKRLGIEEIAKPFLHMSQIVNNFIRSTSSCPGWEQAAVDSTKICMISSLDLSRLSVRGQPQYAEPPAFPFVHYTPQMINDFVRSEFPGTALNCALFIILDSYSVQDGTCIIAQNLLREDPFLMLVRKRFDDALVEVATTAVTSLSFETITSFAMSKDGVA